ncbi:hypothetical protein UA08_09283 [Talaromyces atroroseus]|uniref:Glycoside hydrolase family 3 N-terminal domain-containing protein n=1 Tax=Talaromyces atroroseus TaxID=1441469 RepID=A0A1Q5Q6I6_TALAT|nr:hypothetical protein UA08_09283 [Talaromyces atroroseus]OKL55456.1 hypothetical protein UA08_09283 [Talaromyces atroroseus]
MPDAVSVLRATCNVSSGILIEVAFSLLSLERNMDDNELSRLVGSLCLMGIDGTSMTTETRKLIETYAVGAIILTSKNLKCYARPLLIAVDQEGGSINSLNADEVTQFPSAMGLAATQQQDLVEKAAHAIAQELRCLGFNWILGPVLDVLPTTRVQPLGVRTFGDDPFAVATYGAHMIKGFKSGGIATGGKHFPGYGDTSFPDDSPENVPCILYSKAQLHQNQFVPFREAIQHNVDSILVGGCAMTGLGEETVPHACLSHKVVTDILRHELGFDGVIVSECLAMEALCENIGVSQGAIMAILAGCDFIMVCQTYQTQLEALSGLKLGVQRGHIPIQVVNTAVERINLLKDRLTSWDQALYPGGIPKLNELNRIHSNISLQAYRQSVSLIRDTNAHSSILKSMSANDDILLLTPLLDLFPSTLTKRHHESDWTTRSKPGHFAVGEDIFQKFGLSLANARNGPITHTSYSSNGLRPSHEALISQAAAVIIVTADVTRNSYQYGVTKYVNMMCKSQKDCQGNAKPLIVVAVSTPYDFLEDLDIQTYICLYDYTKPALNVLVDILTGKFLPTGVPELASMRHRKTAKNILQPRTQFLGQMWLVENYDPEKDGPALQRLLKGVPGIQNYHHPWSTNFEARIDGIENNHFVVKNSSNGTIHGFCATYYIKSTSRAYIAACIVNPHRRRMGIGGSICTYAIAWLSENKKPAQIQWCYSFPALFSTPELAQRESTQRADMWMNHW